jgi:hypothetical protein
LEVKWDLITEYNEELKNAWSFTTILPVVLWLDAYLSISIHENTETHGG